MCEVDNTAHKNCNCSHVQSKGRLRSPHLCWGASQGDRGGGVLHLFPPPQLVHIVHPYPVEPGCQPKRHIPACIRAAALIHVQLCLLQACCQDTQFSRHLMLMKGCRGKFPTVARHDKAWQWLSSWQSGFVVSRNHKRCLLYMFKFCWLRYARDAHHASSAPKRLCNCMTLL